MNLNFIAQNFGWLTNVLLLLALFLTLRATHILFTPKSREELIKIKRPVYVLLTFGLAFLSAALSIKNIFQFLGIPTFPSAADFFFSFSYIFFIAAFGYFWYATRKLHRLPKKERIFLFFAVVFVLLWLYYLFFQVVETSDLSKLGIFLSFFYPSAVSLMFVMTLGIPSRLKAGLICTPLWYFSCAIFTYFVGFMLLTYTSYSSYAPGLLISYFLFFLSSAYFVLGSLVAKRKFVFVGHKIHHHIIKKLTRARE